MTDWMVEKHEPYSKVFTHHPASFDSKYVTSHPGIPWHVDRSFDALVSSPMPKKTKDLSWIVGDAMELPGHKKRWAFLEYIRRQSSFEIDLYGRAVKFIEDKWDGLAPYRFSLAIENTRGPDYWTEKVADCFLSWTVPFYYGCTNLTDYFPKESFIEIDIDRPLTSLEKIKASVDNGAWLNRVPALEEARRLVLHKYQLFPHLVGLIHTYGYQNASKVALKIPTYMRSSKARIYRTVRKLKKTLRLM
ncbi:MAG: hypothetical protein JW883_02690 [Deltaproteobacteria bacterium]|nr:hypothetical protein [Deltaproteobacteria bacterium]